MDGWATELWEDDDDDSFQGMGMGGIKTRREKMSNQATTLIAFAVHQYKNKTALRRILPVVVVVEGQQIPWRLLLCLHTHCIAISISPHPSSLQSAIPITGLTYNVLVWLYMTSPTVCPRCTTCSLPLSFLFHPISTQPICSSSRNNSHEIQITPLSWPSFSYRTHVPLLP